jgi:hypothetical protein
VESVLKYIALGDQMGVERGVILTSLIETGL